MIVLVWLRFFVFVEDYWCWSDVLMKEISASIQATCDYKIRWNKSTIKVRPRVNWASCANVRYHVAVRWTKWSAATKTLQFYTECVIIAAWHDGDNQLWRRVIHLRMPLRIACKQWRLKKFHFCMLFTLSFLQCLSLPSGSERNSLEDKTRA